MIEVGQRVQVRCTDGHWRFGTASSVSPQSIWIALDRPPGGFRRSILVPLGSDFMRPAPYPCDIEAGLAVDALLFELRKGPRS